MAVDRYIDTARRGVTIVAETQELGDERLWFLDLESSSVLVDRSSILPASVLITQPINSHNYPPDGWANTGSPSAKTETTLCQDGGGANCSIPGSGTCRYHLNRNVGVPGIPDTPDYPNARKSDTADVNGVPIIVERFVDVGCATTPWSGISPPSYDFYVNNAYYWVARMAAVKNHTYSYFYQFPVQYSGAANVLVTTYDFNGGPEGGYHQSRKEMRLRQHPAIGYYGAENLLTISHEYGHFVHDTHGMDGTQAVAEGIASSFSLMYLIHNKFVQGIGNAYYGMNLTFFPPALPAQHGRRLLNGEWIQTHWGGSGPSEAPLYDGQIPNCVADPYGCGSVLTQVYWELAWNTCQIGFGDCSYFETAVVSLPQAPPPFALANAAFAYATHMMPSGGTQADFLDLVYTRYSHFLSSLGYIASGSFANVVSLLAHHCAGFAEHCSDGSYRLVGAEAPLPNSQTHKVDYVEAESGLSTCGADCSTMSAPNQSSAGAFARIQGMTGPYARYLFPVVATGAETRKIRVLNRLPGGSAPGLEYRLTTPAGVVGNWSFALPSIAPPNVWKWDNLATISVPAYTNGTYKIDIRRKAGYPGGAIFDADVVLFQKQ